MGGVYQKLFVLFCFLWEDFVKDKIGQIDYFGWDLKKP